MKRKAPSYNNNLPYKKRKGVYQQKPNTTFPTRNVNTPRPEKKAYDIVSTIYPVNTTGSFTCLHIPQLGTDYTNRVGRKTVAKSLYVRGFMYGEAALGAAPATVAVGAQQGRMIIFVDSQPTPATALVPTDLLVSAHPTSQLNLDNRDRFRILKDKCFSFDPYMYSTTATQSLASGSRQIYNIKCYLKLNLETVFNGTNGGTIADITSGALYMFFVGSQAAGTNADADARVSTRVRFIDN